ncbi:cytochrome-c peroxidase [Mangrovicoccus algicola]|uniref:Methylamine utilization protein MauG n=1 Tax=Mangrovicoccus algicola TaxID=2771008 RepID=A0A8J7CZV4_9RHOB|nr:cytochrome c peroxidase [Mangrovicoccus algicola]MBE3638503.1 methylamine utilization protein MauG [Mangrovicoccus algicola]
MRRLFLTALLTLSGLCPAAAQGPDSLVDLGRALFFETALSANRTQSCASCHMPEAGFSDPRGAASPGDDGISLGDRNAPSIGYAVLTPDFHRREDGRYAGGQFWDGRAGGLAAQAGMPPLNPAEMGMPDEAAVVARLRADPDYVSAFARLFGADVLEDAETGYRAMTEALAAYEAGPDFASFDSRYDRYLRGEAELTREEELGRILFFSQQFTNCNQCHQLGRSEMDPRETFTSYEYHNIGTPRNTRLRGLNGIAPDLVDEGLFANPLVADPAERGKFKTPSLRNVAVTGPYMHNGVFEDLRTVVLFYNRYNTRDPDRLINPETGAPFGPAPVPETLSMTELTSGPALDDQRIDAIVAFLRTLTDARYEPLLED